jgi:hypothetical protein
MMSSEKKKILSHKDYFKAGLDEGDEKVKTFRENAALIIDKGADVDDREKAELHKIWDALYNAEGIKLIYRFSFNEEDDDLKKSQRIDALVEKGIMLPDEENWRCE